VSQPENLSEAYNATEAKCETEDMSRTTFGAAFGWIAAWAWTLVAAGGGLWLLWTKGPWPLTNGWFALLSGVSACPVTARLLKKYAAVTVSGYVQIAAAVFFFVAGRIALAVGS
jgi:hypothetical protein